MVIGVLTLELHFGEANSLKEKRRLLKSILDRIRLRFNVSTAEIGGQKQWQISTVGIAMISNEGAYVNQVLSAVTRFVESTGKAEILTAKTEVY